MGDHLEPFLHSVSVRLIEPVGPVVISRHSQLRLDSGRPVAAGGVANTDWASLPLPPAAQVSGLVDSSRGQTGLRAVAVVFRPLTEKMGRSVSGNARAQLRMGTRDLGRPC